MVEYPPVPAVTQMVRLRSLLRRRSTMTDGTLGLRLILHTSCAGRHLDQHEDTTFLKRLRHLYNGLDAH